MLPEAKDSHDYWIMIFFKYIDFSHFVDVWLMFLFKTQILLLRESARDTVHRKRTIWDSDNGEPFSMCCLHNATFLSVFCDEGRGIAPIMSTIKFCITYLRWEYIFLGSFFIQVWQWPVYFGVYRAIEIAQHP